MDASRSDPDEADLIPDWAAIAVAVGILATAIGFVSLWFTQKEWPIVAVVLGLVVAAIGMRAAEDAISAKSDWQPLA
jgi:hypothetical protein